MFYPDNVIEDIRSANDIVGLISQYTRLTQRGGGYVGLCPFHREKTPSFSVSADKQVYHCFGCGASGNVLTFVMQKENYDFKEAVSHLAERAGYRLPEPGQNAEYQAQRETREKLLDIHTRAARWFYDALTSERGRPASDYLDGRGMGAAARRRFGLGYSPPGWDELYKFLSKGGADDGLLVKSGLIIADNKGRHWDRFSGRLMFPIFDVYNKVIGFGGRILGSDGPKYLNSPETPLFSKSKNLYGINYARLSKSREFILAEGYMDVIALHEAGFANSVASLGTAFNEEHARVLRKYCDGCVLLFDSDEAGEKAALRAIPVLSAAGLAVKVLQLKGAKDPDEFLRGFGREKFVEALKNADNHVSFQFKCLKKRYDLNDPPQKARFTAEAAKVVAALPGAIERDIYANELARVSGVAAAAVAAEIAGYVDAGVPDINFTYKNKPHDFKLDSPKADEAAKGLILAMIEDAALAESIAACVESAEMPNAVYARLWEIILKLRLANAPVVHAELINHFETVEEQALVSKIFSLRQVYDGGESRTKALNDQIAAVKRHFIQAEMNKLGAEGAEELENLLESRRKLDNLVLNHYRWIE